MKKKIFMVIALIALSTVAFAAEKFGAKAHAMGGAFTAIADDASAVYWNPAGLTQTKLLGLNANIGVQADMDQISKIADFINDAQKLGNETNSIKLAQGLSELDLPENTEVNLNGMVALNFLNFGLAGIFNDNASFDGEKVKVKVKETDIEKEVPNATAENKVIGQGIFGGGFELIDPPLLGSLSIGGNVKYLYSREDSVTVNAAKLTDGTDGVLEISDAKTDSGIGADLGVLATLTDIDIVNVKAAATIRNLVSTIDVEDPSLKRSTTLGLGATFKFPLVAIFSARVAADLEMIEDQDDAIKHFGAEGTLGFVSVRGGVYGTDLGDEDTRVVTGGLGLNLPFIDFNVAVDSDDYMNLSGTFNF